MDVGSLGSRLLVLLSLSLLFPLLAFIKEFLELLFLSKLLEQLKDHWHIIVSATFIFSAPAVLSRLLSFDLACLSSETLHYLSLARLESLIRLGSQLNDLLLADLVLTEVLGLTRRQGFVQLICQLLGDPLLQHGESGELLLMHVDLVSDDCQEIEADLVACVVLNASLDLRTSLSQPGLI